MSQAVIFGIHPTTKVPQNILTDGNGNLTFSPVAGNVSLRALADNADAVAVTATINSQAVVARNTVFNGTTWDRQKGDTFGTFGIVVGSSAAAAAIAPVVAQAAFSMVGKAAAGNLYEATIIAGAAAGFLVAYNAIAAPAPGAALTAALVLNAVPVAANGVAIITNKIADRFGTGITLIFTTSLTTYTQPANAALFLQAKLV